MPDTPSPIRIGIVGELATQSPDGRGCGLWPVGYQGAITAAGGTPVPLPFASARLPWEKLLDDVDGLVLAGLPANSPRHLAEAAQLCEVCRERRLPFLGVDQGMHVLNTTFGGSLYTDLSRELPEALQHRHPPEKGLRHAILVTLGTRICDLYGEGEVVVNSEHRSGIAKVARGFRVGAQALDGVIEAIESEGDEWWALGVQWLPASGTASGLDIQVFRGLIDACKQQVGAPALAHSSAA
jgi:putative glutamine amidotransferase